VVSVITLKLEAAIKGKPVTGSDISFSAQASAFAKEPVFMLTMDADKEHIPEVKVDACTPATKAAPKGPAKAAPGGAAKKAPAKK